MEIPKLEVCPACKIMSLSFIKASGRYECFNLKCCQSFLPIEIERYNQQTEVDKKMLDDIGKQGRVWFGNQYWDEKKKKWITVRE
jgi:hypothetical protein